MTNENLFKTDDVIKALRDVTTGRDIFEVKDEIDQLNYLLYKARIEDNLDKHYSSNSVVELTQCLDTLVWHFVEFINYSNIAKRCLVRQEFDKFLYDMEGVALDYITILSHQLMLESR